MFKKKKTSKQLTDALVEALRNVSVVRTTGSAFDKGESMPPLSASMVPSKLSEEDQAGLEAVRKTLVEIRLMLCGDSDNPPKKEDSAALSHHLREYGVPFTLIQNLGVLPFEPRNDARQILSYLIQSDLSGFSTKYLRARSTQVIRMIVALFDDPGITLQCGLLLRDCLHYEFLAAEFLEPSFWVLNKFFDDYLVCDSFDKCSDAFSVFRLALTKHMNLVPQFLMQNRVQFFSRYNKLLVSEQYVTQRQSLKLLGEILLDRKNYSVMIHYIGEKDNLKIVMNLMRVKSPAIQMEAFHVFKVFVANPKKTEPVALILARNRDKLVNYLLEFEADKNDEQFFEERNLLLDTLSGMSVPPASNKSTQKPSNNTSRDLEVE